MRAVIFFLFASRALFALTEEPWFSPPFDFAVRLIVDPNFFRTVRDGYHPQHYHSNNLLVETALLVPLLPTIDAELEVTLLKSSKYSFGFESAALQGRMLFLDDLSGDWISWDMGFAVRIVAAQRLHDVATLYHNSANFELTTALGKEWNFCRSLPMRAYFLAALGEANRGYPWARFCFRGIADIVSQLSLDAAVSGYFGFGPENTVDVSHFSSYAFIQHQNIDLSLGLSYFFKIYGELSFLYSLRLFAHAFPDNYQSFRISYTYPFSL